MKLPCAVVRDLLPLYAEHLTEDDTRRMVDEHLESCAECRQKFTELDTKLVTSVDASKPLEALKKEIRKRRWFSALAAALLVFVTVYTVFYHEGKLELVPWQNGLVEVEGIKSRPSSEVFTEEAPSDSSESTVDVLLLKYNSVINGIQESTFKDEDGTTTALIQGWTSQHRGSSLTKDYSEMTLYPVPDRLLYSVGRQQQLLWGEPLNGGVEVLPRLALAYYLYAAAGLTLVAAAVWFFFRNRASSWIPRQILFAPVSYLMAHLMIKGTGTQSFFMEQDFISIVLIAVALYAFFSLAWQIWLERRQSE